MKIKTSLMCPFSVCLIAIALCAVMGVATCFLGTAQAAEGVRIGLEEAVGMALETNRTIEQAEEDRTSAKWALSEARRNGGPKVSWSMSGMHIGGGSYESARRSHESIGTPSYDNEFSNQVNLTFPLYTGGNLEGRIEAARYGLNAADLALEDTDQQIRYETKAAYYRVIQCQNLIDVRLEAVRKLEVHLQTIQIQYEHGVAAKLDLLTSEVRLADQQQALVKARGDWKKAMAQLNNIIGLPANTPLELDAISDAVEAVEDVDQCIEYAYENRPDVFAANYAVKRAKALVDAAKSGYRPTLALSASKSIKGEGATFRQDHGETWNVGVQGQWDIFDNGITAAKVEEAQSDLRKAESQASQAKEKAELSVVTAWTDLMTARENIITARSAIQRAEEDYSLAQVRYVEGVDTNLAVMDSQEKLVEARTNYYNAIADAQTSKAELDKAMGVPVRIRVPSYLEAVEAGASSSKALAKAAVDASEPETR